MDKITMENINKLFRQGWKSEEIAHVLKLSKGEVELSLELSPVENKNAFKIVTWNMDYWRRKKIDSNQGNAWAFLKNLNADISLLQESHPNVDYFHNINLADNVYYQELPYLDWGSTILAKGYTSFCHTFSSSYDGSQALMAYDFFIKNKKITVINVYGKRDSNELYDTTLHHMISDITPIIYKNKDNLIVLAGDFNASEQPTENYPDGEPTCKIIFERIRNLGFINCTKEEFGGHIKTIKHGKSNYQDDYIFVNKRFYDKEKIKIKLYNDSEILDYSDHYILELNILL